ncbi:hypothetical protein M427DRAFT_296801 [Gonapodya prolifera JEL478]|uniref:Zn(2)-C6 fungal-type domain-containing protein n=1 Tax=Gonapodya prolifera (strain JEL478) TaxID=1344416 RepID=A0A139AIJ4_GONPJ|nr:hypothetical protein M427DRAFT_296801 [Gonapodya prolifera JEL478]|eukprot:KXS16374.1 hypothetical protein M427DRAFT_296801 [Gonapodya prolifera JEL478]
MDPSYQLSLNLHDNVPLGAWLSDSPMDAPVDHANHGPHSMTAMQADFVSSAPTAEIFPFRHQGTSDKKKARRTGAGAANRSSVACDSCHKSKKKCDGNRPCSLCQRSGRECIYTPKQPRKKLSRAEYIALLESKVHSLQSALTETGRADLLETMPAVPVITSVGGSRSSTATAPSAKASAPARRDSSTIEEFDIEGSETSEDEDGIESGDDLALEAAPRSLSQTYVGESGSSGRASRRSSTLESTGFVLSPTGRAPLSVASATPSTPAFATSSTRTLSSTSDRPIKEAKFRNRSQSGDFAFPPTIVDPHVPLSLMDPMSAALPLPTLTAPHDPVPRVPPDYNYVYLQSLFPEYGGLSHDELSLLLMQTAAQTDPGAAATRSDVYSTTHLFSSIPVDHSGAASKKRRVDGSTPPSVFGQAPFPGHVGPATTRVIVDPNRTRSPSVSQPPPQTSPIASAIGSPPSSGASEADSGDPLSQAIRLRDKTSYFDASARARYHKSKASVDFAMEEYLNTTTQMVAGLSVSGDQTEVSRGDQFSPSSKATSSGSAHGLTTVGATPEIAQDPEAAALTKELENLGMNPSQSILRLMRRMVPPDSEMRWDLLHVSSSVPYRISRLYC